MNVQATIYALFRGLSRLACWPPRRLALAAGAGFGTLVYALYRLTPYRGFIEGNLRVAYGPGLGESAARAIARAHLQQLGRAIAEILRFPLLASAELPVRFEGWEHVEAARQLGRGVIVATAHFGNWELLGAALARRGLPLHVLVQRPSQAAFDRLFKEFRTLVGVSTWENRGAASLRPILRALARNEALGLLADQHGEARDAIVQFFGRPVSAPTGAFYFARRTGAVVLPMFIVREADGRHVVQIEPPIAPSGHDPADCQHLYAHYERFVRRHPDHWLWSHDRWAREGELAGLSAPTPVAAAPPATIEAGR